MKIKQDVLDWLTNGPSWINYRTRLDLLDQDLSNEAVQEAKRLLLQEPLINDLVDELKYWPGYALQRHNDAKHLIHKLVFAADIGLRKDHPAIKEVSEKLFKLQSAEGPLQVLTNVPTRYGGSGEDELSWMLCDAPLSLYALAKFGFQDEKPVVQSAEYLASLIRENGWPCATADSYKGFRGPGRKSDPCPYANLITLKALLLLEKWKDSEECKIGAETLLNLWEIRKERKPYLFGMGTDFKKLKAPLIWYDILHVTEVLSQINWVHQDKRFHEMIEILESKFDENGKCPAESVWRAWKEWDFGQKREPSRWITFLVYRVLKRIKS